MALTPAVWPMMRHLAAFDPTDPATWVEGGVAVVAVMTVLFMYSREWIVPGPSHQRLVAELEQSKRREAEKDIKVEALHQLIETRELDTLFKVNTVLADVLELLKERQMRDRIRAELSQESKDPRR